MADALVNGIRLHYEVHGEGTPLVLAHGYGATLDMWSQQVEPFSSKYRLVIYDTRGHGRTEAPRDWSAYNVYDYVEDQRQLMDQLGIDSGYVGGLSMGGMIALQFALTYPERVKALLLCDTAASNRRLGGTVNDADGPVSRTVRGFVVRDVVPLTFFLARYLPLEQFPRIRSAPEGVKSYIHQMRQHTALGLRGAWHTIMSRPDVENRLGEIHVPTLIVVGERDDLLGASRAMQERIAGCRFVLIKDSRHGTADWRPEAFTKAVLDFLSDVDAGRPVAGEETL
jgi:pimeloyl-ACP methyl ester carboxylesterase